MGSEFKTDATGRQRLKASYIMRKDPRARAAYDALRRRGLSREEAADQIEITFEQSFREVLFAMTYGDDELSQIARARRKAEIWISLQEGLSIEAIFPSLPPRPGRPS